MFLGGQSTSRLRMLTFPSHLMRFLRHMLHDCVILLLFSLPCPALPFSSPSSLLCPPPPEVLLPPLRLSSAIAAYSATASPCCNRLPCMCLICVLCAQLMVCMWTLHVSVEVRKTASSLSLSRPGGFQDAGSRWQGSRQANPTS